MLVTYSSPCMDNEIWKKPLSPSRVFRLGCPVRAAFCCFSKFKATPVSWPSCLRYVSISDFILCSIFYSPVNSFSIDTFPSSDQKSLLSRVHFLVLDKFPPPSVSKTAPVTLRPLNPSTLDSIQSLLPANNQLSIPFQSLVPSIERLIPHYPILFLQVPKQLHLSQLRSLIDSDYNPVS